MDKNEINILKEKFSGLYYIAKSMGYNDVDILKRIGITKPTLNALISGAYDKPTKLLFVHNKIRDFLLIEIKNIINQKENEIKATQKLEQEIFLFI